MKNLIYSLGHVIATEKLIPANLGVLIITTMDVDMVLKISLTVLMIVLTAIKIHKELRESKYKNTEN